jgi:hypothetical protein
VSKAISHLIRSRRFYVPADPADCWEWTGTRTPDGYGQIRRIHNGSTMGAHRAVYEDRIGPIPDGLHLDHLCRNPPCVNPAHLEPVTNRENGRRGLAAPRSHCPGGHSYAEHGYQKTARGGRSCRKCDTARTRRWKESNPQKVAVCVTCSELKPMMAKGQCNACYLKTRRALRGRSDRPA